MSCPDCTARDRNVFIQDLDELAFSSVLLALDTAATALRLERTPLNDAFEEKERRELAQRAAHASQRLVERLSGSPAAVAILEPVLAPSLRGVIARRSPAI